MIKQISIESEDCKSKHKYYDVIVAWANGEKIQHRYPNEDKWFDFCFDNEHNGAVPAFNSKEWRIKPRTITRKYRMALIKDSLMHYVVALDVNDYSLEFAAEREVAGFIRWVSDIVDAAIS